MARQLFFFPGRAWSRLVHPGRAKLSHFYEQNIVKKILSHPKPIYTTPSDQARPIEKISDPESYGSRVGRTTFRSRFF